MEKLVNSLQLKSLVMSYLQANHRIEEATAELTERVCRYIVKLFGDLEVKDFGYEQAERFQNWVIESGRNKVTANIYIKTIRPVFRWVMKWELITKGPFENLHLFRIPKQRIRIFEPAEFERLLIACPDKLWQVRLLLGKTAAMRKGEVLNLTVDDVDFNRGIIYIQPKKETRFTWRWIPKDKDVRELPLVPKVSDLLVEILMDLPEGQPYLMIPMRRYIRNIKLKEQGILLDRIRKRPDENWSKPWKRILKRAEIKSGTFKTLRKTCITEWLENGLHPHEVMKLAGHSSIETTLNYYVTTRRTLLNKARLASGECLGHKRDHKSIKQLMVPDYINSIGATGLEPATS